MATLACGATTRSQPVACRAAPAVAEAAEGKAAPALAKAAPGLAAFVLAKASPGRAVSFKTVLVLAKVAPSRAVPYKIAAVLPKAASLRASFEAAATKANQPPRANKCCPTEHVLCSGHEKRYLGH